MSEVWGLMSGVSTSGSEVRGLNCNLPNNLLDKNRGLYIVVRKVTSSVPERTEPFGSGTDLSVVFCGEGPISHERTTKRGEL